MSANVIAIVVAREAGEILDGTLHALTTQTRTPHVIIGVDLTSRHAASAQFAQANITNTITASPRLGLGAALELATSALAIASGPEQLLWLLGEDSSPAPDALAELLAVLEVSPSVAIVGPKQMSAEEPDYIAEFGLTLAPGGRTVSLVAHELDQGQYDYVSDVLAVGANGLLVRHNVWTTLRGFDAHLTSVDDALDFCVRARLAGHRVAGAPVARVMTTSTLSQTFAQVTPREFAKRNRQYRAAELYRRLVYSTSGMLFWHWLGLGPTAIARALGQLLAKRPGAVWTEIAAALSAAFSGGAVGRARSSIRRTRSTTWAALVPLLTTRAEVRRRFSLARESARVLVYGERQPIHFFSTGGAWVTLALAVVSVIAFAPLLGASAVAGGALLPMGNNLSDIWSSVGYGLRAGAVGVVGPADAFTFITAVLATLTWWQPGLSLVVVWFAAIPLAGLGAWFLASRFSRRPSIRAFIAIVYALSPPLLAALHDGRPAAVMLFILLPWLFFAGIIAMRSLSASATTALLFAAVVACAPSLWPGLLVIWLAVLIFSGRAVARFIAIPIPALVLFAPLALMQLLRGNVLSLMADPGIAVPYQVPAGWQVALGFPVEGLGGWTSTISFLPWSLPAAGLVVVIFIAVLVALAVVGLFSQHPVRTQVSMAVTLIGVVTAVLATIVSVSFAGSVAVSPWPGNGLALAWLGLAVAAGTGASILKRFSFYPVIVGVVAVVLLAVPALASMPLGASNVWASTGKNLPAYVNAQAQTNPTIGTLIITAQPDGGVHSQLVRGSGLTLASASSYVATGAGITTDEQALSQLTANLVSITSSDSSSDLSENGIGFVLLAPAQLDSAESVTPTAQAMQGRATASLNANASLESVGATDMGYLWRNPHFAAQEITVATSQDVAQPWRALIITLQALMIVLTLLVAFPTGDVRSTAGIQRRMTDWLDEPEDIGPVDLLAGEHDVEEN